MARINTSDTRDYSSTSSLVPPVFAKDPDSLLPSNEEELKESLQGCFSAIQSDGSFALFEALSNSPDPRIHLKKGGGIGLPLSDRGAQAIVQASHAAPFGKGEETILDTSVRKTWEVSPNEFELRNPAWQTYVQTIVAKVSCGLGVDATGKGVVAELYKMLLYEEGAMFKPHQDHVSNPQIWNAMLTID